MEEALGEAWKKQDQIQMKHQRCRYYMLSLELLVRHLSAMQGIFLFFFLKGKGQGEGERILSRLHTERTLMWGSM